jgi:hypothetical protein
VLDLVGIPSILPGARLFFHERRDMLLDRRQPVIALRIDFRPGDDAAVQTLPHASKLAQRHVNFVPAVVAAIRVLSFASVVLLE